MRQCENCIPQSVVCKESSGALSGTSRHRHPTRQDVPQPEEPDMAEPPPPLAEALRLAGHDLPTETLRALDPGHALLRAMLARLGATPPEAEPAPVFRPDGPR